MRIIVAIALTTLILNIVASFLYLLKDIKFIKEEVSCCKKYNSLLKKIKFISRYIITLVLTVIAGYLIISIDDYYN